VSLSVCLLLDEAGDRAVRGLWRRLESAGVRTLLSHTHGRHVPHLTLASLSAAGLDDVRTAMTGLAQPEPMPMSFDALGMFPRSRCWLVPTVPSELAGHQEQVAAAAVAAGIELHRSYRPGSWLPHLTLAPRMGLAQLPVLAQHVFEILPLSVTLDRRAVVDTSTGDVHPV
jgi:hypothetical protein